MDVKIFNGAGGGPHAVADAAALKGRAGGTGGAHQPVLVADHDLAVGADVDEQAHLLGFDHLAGMHPGNDIAAHIAGDAGVEKEADAGVGMDPERRGLGQRKLADARHVRRLADIFRVQAEEQVRHHRVAGGHDVTDIRRADHHVLADIIDDAVDGRDHLLLQGPETAGPTGIDDPGDDILAVPDLGVVAGGLGNDLAVVQVDEHPAAGGGADVYRQAVEAGSGVP